MAQRSEYDVVIIGARVAGAILAAHLGEGGLRVLLVDKASFPSPTLSTHFFRGRATLDILGRLGVLGDVMAHGSPPLYYVYSYAKNAAQAAPTVPTDDLGAIGHNLSVRRVTIDDVLVRRACQSPNVTFMDKTTATELVWEAGRVCGVRLRQGGAQTEVRCQVLVGADGRNSRVAQWVDAAAETREAGYRGIFYCYVRGFQGPSGRLDGAEFSQWGDEVAYVFPSDHERTCLAMSLNLERFDWMRQDAKNRFWQRLSEYACFDGRLASLEMDGDILGCGPLPNYMRVPYGPGWALVGDAGLHIDPWSGHGMDNASCHAFFLANALLDFQAGRSSLEGALAAYHQFRNESSRTIYEDTVNASKNLNLLDPDYVAL